MKLFILAPPSVCYRECPCKLGHRATDVQLLDSMEGALAFCPKLLDMCGLLYWRRCKDSCLIRCHPAHICRCRPSCAAAAWIDTLPPQSICRQMLLGPWWPFEPVPLAILSLWLQISNPPAENGSSGWEQPAGQAYQNCWCRSSMRQRLECGPLERPKAGFLRMQ